MRMRNKRRSRLDKKDPTRSIRRINRFHHVLVNAIRRYRVSVQGALKEAPTRELETALTPTALTALKKKVAKSTETLVKESEEIIKKSVPEAYRAGTTFGSQQMVMPPESIKNEMTRIGLLIEKNTTIFSGISEDMSTNVLRVISDGLIEGKPVREIAEDIDEVTDVGISRATTMARTEIMYAVNTGTKDRYRSAGIEKVEWISAVDAQSCEECDALDGQVFNIDEAPPCPAHPNCRCTLAPVMI